MFANVLQIIPLFQPLQRNENRSDTDNGTNINLLNYKVMEQKTLSKLYALSVSIEANIRLLERAINENNKDTEKLFITELKKDRERLINIISVSNVES